MSNKTYSLSTFIGALLIVTLAIGWISSELKWRNSDAEFKKNAFMRDLTSGRHYAFVSCSEGFLASIFIGQNIEPVLASIRFPSSVAYSDNGQAAKDYFQNSTSTHTMFGTPINQVSDGHNGEGFAYWAYTDNTWTSKIDVNKGLVIHKILVPESAYENLPEYWGYEENYFAIVEQEGIVVHCDLWIYFPGPDL